MNSSAATAAVCAPWTSTCAGCAPSSAPRSPSRRCGGAATSCASIPSRRPRFPPEPHWAAGDDSIRSAVEQLAVGGDLDFPFLVALVELDLVHGLAALHVAFHERSEEHTSELQSQS